MQNLVFSGIQPSSSQVHLGNYLGALKRFVKLQDTYPVMVCIVDLHALTSVKSKEEMQTFSKSLAATYLALGLIEDKTIIFKQSDIPEVCELSWYFSCNFPLGLLERAHAFKDKRQKNIKIDAGLMFYPILMAADILLYKATLVPVGADQKQHVEMTREIAEKFNYMFKTDFPLPEPIIDQNVGVITGLDGRKMSKSYDNYIGLFEEEKIIRKKINRIVTDSKGVEEEKNPDECNIFKLFKHFASIEEIKELSDKYKKGGMGYGKAKEELFDVMMRELRPIREKYDYYMNNQNEINRVLKKGAAQAREIAEKNIKEVRELLGFTNNYS